MRIYIAGAYQRRIEFLELKEVLEAAGHEITSSWLTGEHDNIEPRLAADIDLDDIDRSDTIILVSQNGQATSSGGRHFEFGYAYARGKRMILFGNREGVFHHMIEIEQYHTMTDLVANL